MILGKSGKYEIHPSKFCASLALTAAFPGDGIWPMVDAGDSPPMPAPAVAGTDTTGVATGNAKSRRA